MSFPEPFPEEILDEIRDYPGNDKCCDCPSIDTDWASVSHGTLICLDCAGKHRSLGVHVSFVRSITMDTWSRQQVEMMRQGGNGQVRRFFKKLEIDNSPIHILYCTKGAEHYREKLKERVEKIMNGEIKSEKRLVKKKSFTEEKSIATSSSAETPTFDVSFGEGPLGLTLTKDYKERASVSRLVPAGAAQLAGVLVGDFIVGVAGKKLSNYDEIMHMIPCMGRPLTLKFGRIPTPKSSKASHSTSATHDHIHSSRSEPNLAQSSLYRSPESTQRKHPPSSLTIKVSSSAEPLQAEEPKKETLSKPIPRVAIRGSKKSGADPDSAEMEYVETAIKPKSTSKLVRRPLNKGSNDSLQKMEQSSAIESSVDSMCSEQRLTQSEKIVKSVWRDSKLLHDEANSTHDEEEDDNDIDNNDNEEEDESSGDSSDDDVGNDIEDEMEEEDEEEDEQSEEMDEKEDEHEEEEQEGEDLHKGDRHQFHQGGDVDEIVESAGRDDNPRYNTSENNNDYGVFVHEDDGNVPEEQISTRSAFEPGSVVKVLRQSDNRWKNAVIHRVHKDGTFKVIYSNGTKESHVQISRIASNAVVLGPAPAGSVSHLMNQTPHTNKYHEALSSITFEHFEAATDNGKDFEFKVDANEDLDAWIEKDLASELKSIDVQYEDSYFRKKTVQGPPIRAHPSTSFARTEIETATYKEFSVTFEQAPLGLTLSANKYKEPAVIRIKLEGNAQMAGIAIGDVLLQIDQYPVNEYDEAMRILPGCIYPLTLRFRRGARNLVLESGEAIMKGSIFVASKLMDTMGLNNKTSILDQPTPVRVSGSSKQFPATTVPSAPAVAKPRYLPPSPSEGEFDIVFEQGELGFRLDEKPGISVVSVVTEVSDKGQAQQKGLKMGCILVGINRDPYLSHAHAVSTLKHSKRPVTVRFKHRNYS